MSNNDSILKIKKLLKINNGIENFLNQCFKSDLNQSIGTLLSITGNSASGKTTLVNNLCSYLLDQKITCSLFSLNPSTQLLSLDKNNFALYQIDSCPQLEGTYDNIFKLMAKSKSKVIILDDVDQLRHDLNNPNHHQIAERTKKLHRIVDVLLSKNKFLIITNCSRPGVAPGARHNPSGGASPGIAYKSSVVCTLAENHKNVDGFLLTQVTIQKTKFSIPGQKVELRIPI